MMKLHALLLVLLLPLSNVAWAEGGSCPNGYYPIGGGGASGCAPIPGYNNGSSNGPSDSSSSLPTRLPPPRVWAARWGAIAVGKNGSGFGAAAGKMTEQQAQHEAMTKCQATSTTTKMECSVTLSYTNQCAAFALGERESGGGWGSFGYSHAIDIATAEKIALDFCKKNSKTCKIHYSGCSLDERVDPDVEDFLKDPQNVKYLEGYWAFTHLDENQKERKVAYKDSCFAYFVKAMENNSGHLKISGFGGSETGAKLTFIGQQIPRPKAPKKIKATLTQSGEKPQTVMAVNYAEPNTPWGAIALEVPTLEDALAGMDDIKSFGVAVDGKTLVEVNWHGGLAARDKLRQCESQRLASVKK